MLNCSYCYRFFFLMSKDIQRLIYYSIYYSKKLNIYEYFKIYWKINNLCWTRIFRSYFRYIKCKFIFFYNSKRHWIEWKHQRVNNLIMITWQSFVVIEFIWNFSYFRVFLTFRKSLLRKIQKQHWPHRGGEPKATTSILLYSILSIICFLHVPSNLKLYCLNCRSSCSANVVFGENTKEQQ